MSLPRAVRFLQVAVSALLQLGKGGPRLKANGAAIESRNAADAAFVPMRVDTAVGASDAVPLAQLLGLIVAGSSIPGTIVWEPGGAALQPANVFIDATPAAALAAFQALAGDKTFMISDRGSPGNAAIPAGFALAAGAANGHAVLAGIGSMLSPTDLSLGEGCTVSGFNEIRRLSIFNDSSVPPIVLADGAVLRLTEATSIGAPALQPVISLAAGLDSRIVMFDTCSLSGQPNTDIAAGASLEVLLLDAASLAVDCLSGAGTINVYASAEATPNAQGTATVTRLSAADNISYNDIVPSIGASTVQDAIARLRTSFSSIVWRPNGGGTPEANVFTQALPTDALAAFALLSGDRTFILDGSGTGGIVTIPLGLFSAGSNPGKCTLAGRSQGVNGPLQPVTFAGGATIAGWHVLRDMDITNASIGVVYDMPADTRVEFRNCNMRCTGGAALCSTAVNGATIALFDSCYVENAGSAVFRTTVALGAALLIMLYDRVTLEGNVATRGGIGTSVTIIQASSAATPGTQGSGVNISNEATAEGTAYNAVGGAGVWGGTLPTNLQTAINRIAAEVASLNGGPIP